MTATRSALAIFVGAMLATGCLFPSFDDMKGAPKGGIAEHADDNVTESNGATASPSSNGSNASNASDASTSDAPSSAPASASIACDTEAGLCPADGKSFCCATIGGPSCQGPGTEAFCTGVEGGKILRCDDRSDCSGNNVCCFLAGAKEAACMPSCGGGAVLCSKDDSSCPTGQSCTGVFNHGGSFSSSFCQ